MVRFMHEDGRERYYKPKTTRKEDMLMKEERTNANDNL
jgi:hypothetical protein